MWGYHGACTPAIVTTGSRVQGDGFLIAIILGGLGSLPGAVAGGFLLGVIELFLRAYLPGSLLAFREAFAILIVIAILFYRPQGLMGRPIDVAR